MKRTDKDPIQLWQEKLADQLRRGVAKDIKLELRRGLYHVVALYPKSSGEIGWESHAKYARAEAADDAVRVVKRLTLVENN